MLGMVREILLDPLMATQYMRWRQEQIAAKHGRGRSPAVPAGVYAKQASSFQQARSSFDRSFTPAGAGASSSGGACREVPREPPPLHRDILEEERLEDRPQPKPLLLQQGPRKSQGNLHRPRIHLLRAQVRSQGKHRHQEMMMGGPEDLPPHQCKKWHPRKLLQREHRQHRPSISPGRPNHTPEGAWSTICEFLASHWQMQE